jgi:hypothetical protein
MDRSLGIVGRVNKSFRPPLRSPSQLSIILVAGEGRERKGITMDADTRARLFTMAFSVVAGSVAVITLAMKVL